jgi:carboxypeptidase Taq
VNAAGDVLSWAQATYMPEGGAGARGRQRAMLKGRAHERAVEPALGGLIDPLAHYGESLPYESDDASLIRKSRREFQRKIKIRRNDANRTSPFGLQNSSYTENAAARGQHGSLPHT